MYAKAFAVTPGLKRHFSGRQLIALGTAIGDEATVDLTVFQQLLVETEGPKVEGVLEQIQAHGMNVYAVGAVVKNVRVCSFCHGDDAAGFAAAMALDGLAGLLVPSSLQIGYAGCATSCSDSLMYDIGVVKHGDRFDVYAGGRPTGLSPRPGQMVAKGLRASRLPMAVRLIVQFYQQERFGRETFRQFFDRVGARAIIRSMARFGPVKRNRPPSG